MPTQNEYDIQIKLIIDKATQQVAEFSKQLAGVSQNANLGPLTNKFNQLKASIVDAGQSLRKLQDAAVSGGGAAVKAGAPVAVSDAMFDSSLKAVEGVKTLGTALSSVNGKFNETKAAMGNFQTQGKQFSGLLDEWWHRFGSVAIAFTVVYRAMNALEAGDKEGHSGVWGVGG